MKRIGVVLLFLLVAGCFMSVLAQDKVIASDVKRNPQKYFNREIKIEGTVIQVQPSATAVTQGVYLLEDRYGERIPVRTNELPALGKSFRVTGEVVEDSFNRDIVIIENTRSGLKSIPWALYAAGAAFLLLLLILVILLLVPSKKKSAAREDAGITAGADQAEAPTRDWVPVEEATADFMGVVEVVDGDPSDKGKRFEIVKPVTIIGRGRGLGKGDIRLDAETISREHARLIAKDSGLEIVNISQKNPLIANNKPVSSHPVKDGDTVQIAGTVLRFHLK